MILYFKNASNTAFKFNFIFDFLLTNTFYLRHYSKISDFVSRPRSVSRTCNLNGDRWRPKYLS